MSTTTNLDTLKINYLTKAQYEEALEDGDINENELYFTPSSGGEGTSTPTANMDAQFDSTAHMNSTDMTSSEVSDFVDSLEAQGGSPQKTAFTPTTGSAYSPWGGCYYIKLGHIVNLHLGISGLTAGTGNNVYTLPSEVRPSAQISAAGVGGAVTQVSPVIITSDGRITVYPQGNTYCTLDVTYIV